MNKFSATKIVFVMTSIAVIALTFVGKIDPKDYYALVLVVFYHYYNKPTTPQTVDNGSSNLG